MRQAIPAAAVLHLRPPYVCGSLYQPQHLPALWVRHGLCQPLLLCMSSFIIIIVVVIIIILLLLLLLFSFLTPQCRKHVMSLELF